jgi:hypothetical protein
VTLPSIYRISQPGREPITNVDAVEAVGRAIRNGEPGRFHVDEIGAEPLQSWHTNRQWGVEFERPDGTVALPSDRPA